MACAAPGMILAENAVGDVYDTGPALPASNSQTTEDGAVADSAVFEAATDTSAVTGGTYEGAGMGMVAARP